jgi:predicted ATPase/DNA-binding SARP family transcriptional activator
VEVVGDDGPVALTGKQRHLLAALIVANGRVCGIDELVDVLWGAAPPASGAKLVQVYVSQLRKSLPEQVRVVTRSGAYALEAPVELVDAARFEALVAERAIARSDRNHALAVSLADQALALWRGRAYGDLGYEDFARAEVERLEELRLVVVEERIDALLALGRHAELLGEIRGLADDNPLRERLQAQAMLALYLSGRQSEALEHYAAVRSRLRDELGLEPGQALRTLQQQILRHDPELDLPADQAEPADARSLPAPPGPLIGRGRELADLDRLLSHREPRLIVLTGAGGSGKTRLALEAARRAAPSFANGAVLVELAPVRDHELVLPTIAQALGVSEVAGQPLLDTLVDAVRGRELLVVVDNAEHLRTAARSYPELVARAPRLTLVVTSRAVLHVTGEHVVPVAPLDDDAAVELFGQRARALQPAFEVTKENEHEVRAICRRVDCLPLAVELAAARIPLLTPRLLLARLSESLNILTSGPTDLPARQQTLRETLDWSVGLLDAREREVLGRLAVFPGGATIEGAEDVCGADLDVLATLVDHNLVRRADVNGEPRFGMLETVREYAFELLGDDRPAVERSLAENLAALVDSAELRGPEQATWLVRLDAELDNLRAALARASATGDGEVGLRLAGGLWLYWFIRGSLGEGLGYIEGALARGSAKPTAARARALRGGAGLAYGRGDFERATDLATEAVAVARHVGSKRDEMAGSTILGVVATRRREFDAARGHLRRSAALEQEITGEVVDAKVNLANLELEAGEFEAAATLLEDAVAIRRRPGQFAELGTALLNLGLARYRLGEHERAQASFEEARESFAGIGFEAHVAHARQGLAACAAATGRFDEAAALLGRAAAELAELGWSDDDFDPTLAAEVEAGTRRALGDVAFDETYAVGFRTVAA